MHMFRMAVTFLLILISTAAAAPESQRPRPPVAGWLFGPAPAGKGVKYKDVGPNDMLYPVSINNWWGHMNQRGHLVVFPRFEWTDYSYEGFARAVHQGRTGFIKGTGKWFIDPTYVYADRFEEGYAIVGNGAHFGIIDKARNLIVPMRLDGALRFRDGVAAVLVNGRCGFVNKRGDVAIDPQFARVRSFHNGLAAVQMFDRDGDPGRMAFITRRGRVQFEDRRGNLTDLGDFNESRAWAKVGELYGYMDRSFRMRIEPRFDEARDFTGGLAAVRVGERWGYIHKSGKWAVKPIFQSADDFDEILAMYSRNDLYGFTDRVGKRGLQPQFGWAEPYYLKYARVAVGNSFGYMDVAGRPIWDPRVASEGIINVTTRGKAIATNPRSARPSNQLLQPPPPREQAIAPYPPEYLYEEILPQPESE